MKKRLVAFVLFCIVLIGLLFSIGKSAFAFSGVEVAAAATYAIGSSLGIDWTVTGVNSAFAQEWMETQVQNYDNGESLIESIVGNIAVDAAGKLAIGQAAYNNICGFIDYLRSVYTVDLSLIGTNNVVFDPLNVGNSLNGWAPYPGGHVNDSGFYMEGWSQYGATPPYASTGSGYTFEYMTVRYLSSSAVLVYYYSLGSREKTAGPFTIYYAQIGVNNTQKQAFSYPEEYALPTVLNPDKSWTGTIGGVSTPDTNLDQLIGSVFENVADNNLMVEGEIEDAPIPPGPVPTWTPVDDVIDGINGLGEELDGIGQDIGDISGHLDDIGDQLGDIGDQIGDVTGALEGVQEGIQTQTGVISGAMDQAAQDVIDAIGSQTAALDESLTATAEGIQDITDILTAPEVDTPKFDLRELFPFCIPFDIYHLLQKFDGSPTAPHVQIPIVIPSIGFSYTLDLDFSAWDPVAAAMRTVELIVYALGLAWATSKAIKW